MIYLGNQAVGVAVGVGEFTQYVKKTAAGVGNANTFIEVSTPFAPKLVVISGGTDESGQVISGVMDFVDGIGAVLYRSSASGNITIGGYRPIYTDESPGSGSPSVCRYYNGKIYISRVNASGYFANTDTFTFEIYG